MQSISAGWMKDFGKLSLITELENDELWRLVSMSIFTVFDRRLAKF